MATPRKARLLIPYEGCGTPCEQRNARRRFCSGKCRAAVWQRKRHEELASLEDQAARLLTRLRALQGKVD